MKCLIASREPKGLVWMAALGDRQDARAFAAAHDAVVVLSLAKCCRSLEINDGVEPLPGKGPSLVEPGPRLAQDIIGPARLCLVIEQRGLGQLEDDPSIIGEPRLSKLLVDLLDVPEAHPLEIRTDFFKRRSRRPAIERRQHRRESAGVDRLFLLERNRLPIHHRPLRRPFQIANRDAQAGNERSENQAEEDHRASRASRLSLQRLAHASFLRQRSARI